MDALRIREFFFKSNNELPNSSVSIREDSIASINLQSILFRVLRRVILLSPSLIKSETLIRYPYHNCKRVNTVLKIVIEFMLNVSFLENFAHVLNGWSLRHETNQFSCYWRG